MPALPGDRLTGAYRAAQVRNAAMLALRLQQRWRGVSLDNIESQRAFLDVAVGDVVRHHGIAVTQANSYLGALQSLEAGKGGIVLVDNPPTPNLEQIRRSLAVTGPGAWLAREARAQSDPESARGQADRAVAKSKSAAGMMGAGIRHAQNGARDTVQEYVKKDRRARGWVRVTAQDEKVCYFCAMLASRVNWERDSFEDSNAGFTGDIGTAKVHDSCRCHLRPVYGALPEETLMYREAWASMSGGPKSAVKNFRSNWEARRRDAARVA